MRYPMLGALVAMLLPMAAHAEGDAAAGEKAFAPCKACHAFGKNGVGPDLTGVVGRKAASLDGYSYSAPLKASGLTWDEGEPARMAEKPEGQGAGDEDGVRRLSRRQEDR